MSTIIQAEYERLQEIAARFERHAEASRQSAQHFRRGTERLQESWHGAGSRAFVREMQSEVLPATARLVSALEQSATTIRQISDVLRAAEEEAARLFEAGAGADRSAKGKLDEGVRISGYEESDDPLYSTEAGAPEGTPLIHPDDLSQGSIGDCFFITTLAVIANQNPDILEQAIRGPDEDGNYTVTLYVKKRWPWQSGYDEIEVVVSPDFPTREVYDKETGTWMPSSEAPHAGAGDGELWPRLLEKAYATHLGGGDVTEGYRILNEGGQSGDVMELLTGSKSHTTTRMDHYSIEELAAIQNSGGAITLSSLNENGEGEAGYYEAGDGRLHTTHAYWIDSVDVEAGTITVRNPWGYRDGETHKITMTYEEFKKSFDRIDSNDLVRDK